MKKIVFAILLLLLLFLLSVYLFIPRQIKVASHVRMPVSREAIMRTLAVDTNWLNWWPGESSRKGDSIHYSLGGNNYTPHDARVLSIPIFVSVNKQMLPAEMVPVKLTPDSVALQLSVVISSTNNPFTRIRDYFRAKTIKKDFSKILTAINNYYQSTEHLYGFDIRKEKVVDSILLMNYRELNHKPTADDIYILADELRSYINKQSAKETGFPMLNIFTEDSIHYLLKVAIPVDRRLPPSGNMSYKWMLGGGNILITEVKGGPQEIEKAYKQIQFYISDHNRVAPAIPFESLVTDRRQEKDSSKWITKIYYPVM